MEHPSGAALPQVIQLLHMAIAEHQDPSSKATMAQCLSSLMRIQATDMAQQQKQNPVLSALGGQQ